uniref:glycine--tRNA ligase subunit beta n=1 Tax=Escherichia coli TaxID=562 RepID=UPI0020333BCE
MSEKTFLVEIGTEELPPKALRSLAESFAANFTAELDNAGLAHGTVQWFAAPRRLALKVANLAEAQPDREIEKRDQAPCNVQSDAAASTGNHAFCAMPP